MTSGYFPANILYARPIDLAKSNSFWSRWSLHLVNILVRRRYPIGGKQSDISTNVCGVAQNQERIHIWQETVRAEMHQIPNPFRNMAIVEIV